MAAATIPVDRRSIGGEAARQNVLKIGIFAANCSSGQAITLAPERWQADWEDNERLAMLADRVGLEFLLPLARWRGWGGKSDHQHASFETVTWAAGMLAVTERLTVFGTVHAPLFHPILAAKQMMTVDHIGRGRFGLNVVVGWNQDEFDMFGAEQREHDARYDYAQEWLDVVRGIWTCQNPLRHEGVHLQLGEVRGDPKPYGATTPLIMNAGASPAGRAFAVRNCDVLFTALDDIDKAAAVVAEVRSQARADARDLDIFTIGYLACGATESDARERHHYYAVEMADQDVISRMMEQMGIQTGTYPPDYYEKFRERFGGGASYPIIGDPDQVADELERISRAGFGGIALSTFSYLEDIEFFAQEVLPRLERKGLRVPDPDTTA